MNRAALAAMLSLVCAVAASAQSRADLPARTSEVVRVVRVSGVPSVVTSTTTPDYPGIVLAILDRCVRSHAADASPLAGRALVVITANARAAFVDVVESDGSLASLARLCFSGVDPLPPLPASLATSRILPTGELRVFLEIDVDARGLPRVDPPSSRGPVERPFEVTLDTRSLELDRAADVDTARVVRDDVIAALEPRLASVASCLEGDRRRGAFRGGDLSTRLRIDARGVVRESRVDASLAIDTCVERALVGAMFAPWRSREDVVVRLVLRAR